MNDSMSFSSHGEVLQGCGVLSFGWCTCGARRVDVQSGAPDGDVGPEVPGQRLIGGLGDLVRQGVDALDAAGLRQEVHADALLPQRRQNLLQSSLQLCKQGGIQAPHNMSRGSRCAMGHASASCYFATPPGRKHTAQETE